MQQNHLVGISDKGWIVSVFSCSSIGKLLSMLIHWTTGDLNAKSESTRAAESMDRKRNTKEAKQRTKPMASKWVNQLASTDIQRQLALQTPTMIPAANRTRKQRKSPLLHLACPAPLEQQHFQNPQQIQTSSNQGAK